MKVYVIVKVEGTKYDEAYSEIMEAYYNKSIAVKIRQEREDAAFDAGEFYIYRVEEVEVI